MVVVCVGRLAAAAITGVLSVESASERPAGADAHADSVLVTEPAVALPAAAMLTDTAVVPPLLVVADTLTALGDTPSDEASWFIRVASP